MGQPDDWYARNFAVSDSQTRAYVRNQLIPSWRARIVENEEDATALRRAQYAADDPLLVSVLEQTDALRGHIAAAEERLA